MNKISILVLFFSVLIVIPSKAQNNNDWNIEKTSAPSKTINFRTDEGTWMNLDVSKDGKYIVFDLLGDIYKIPVSGGEAQLLAGGMAWEVQPRFSPNGKYISYTSDKSGGNNIWIMNAEDGSDKKAITKEEFDLLNNAVWTPDGQYLIARKYFTSGAGELWMYHYSGGFDGVQLTQKNNNQQDLGEPWVSPNGNSVYFSKNISATPVFKYNQDPNGEIYQIKKLNFDDNSIETVAGGAGGAVRPQISPDGKLMAFVKRVRLKSVLYIQNLETGEEYPIYDDLSRDQQEARVAFGVYPNFNWMPDSRNLIFYAKGKIFKADVVTQYTDQIPFTVNVKQTIVEALHFEQEVFKKDFEAKMIRQLTTSPDGKKVAFNAAGYIYIKELPSGKPQRLTRGTDWEFEPCFSPNGKNILFTTWNDELKGAICIVSLSDGHIQKLTTEPGFYYSPSFNNKGDKIVFRKGTGNEVLGHSYGKNPGIYLIPAAGGKAQLIYKKGTRPQFSSNDQNLFFQTNENGKRQLKGCDLNGGNLKTYYTSAFGQNFILSPDNKWLAFNELYNVYLTPFMTKANQIELSSKSKAYPVKQITSEAGDYIHWSKDSKSIHWTFGSVYFTKTVNDAFAFAAGDKKDNDTAGTAIGLLLDSDVPKGVIAFKGARIITMKDDEIIENGTIVIEENKIVAVGKEKDIKIPDGAKIYHAYGKTIMPGIIDVHSRLQTNADGISPQQDWTYLANLAYGVTTTLDYSNHTDLFFSQAEMIKSGRMIGPRIYSATSLLYGAEDDKQSVISNLADVSQSIKRLKAIGAFSIKSHHQPLRSQRQQLIEAAREYKMEVMPEGESAFFTDMSMIADGYTGIEHNIPVVPVYKDVVEFWNASKTAYTPTLIVSNGSQWGENYWYDRTNVWENQKLAEFMPRTIIDSRSRRRTTSEYGDYGHIEVSRAVNQIAKGGTNINLGSNGQLQGLGAHWELWMLKQGGMSSLQALKCATINGAAYLGIDKELGSLEKGKLADLIVLHENPLEGIRNSENIQYVMVNGRLYDAETMNELSDNIKVKNKFWWQHNKIDNYLVPDTSY